MQDNLMSLLLVWGVWLLIPIFTDGTSAVWNVFVALFSRKWKNNRYEPTMRVSVVIPAYNEELNINRCLLSLRAQTYPQHLIEIVIVDDGSSDNTVNQVLRYMGTPYSSEALRTSSFVIHSTYFAGTLNIVRRKRAPGTKHGKATAVNAAIDLISGDLVLSVDADVVLAPQAIENAVRAFQSNPEMVAGTGHLIIDPYLTVDNREDSKPEGEINKSPAVPHLTLSERILSACQFIEYLTAFHIGRAAESATDTMFTMSGACAIFRREVLLGVGKFDGRTVSEDTDITLAIHNITGKSVGYLKDTEVHLAPTLNWSDLYSQRVRWQRGALEVSSLYYDNERQNPKKFFWRLALPMRLQVDHTLAMPRIVWTFVIFLIPLFGYSWRTILEAFILLFLFYLVVNIVRVLTAYGVSSPPEKVFVRRYLGYITVFPMYNFFLFWTRISGVLGTLIEDAAWRVENPLLEAVESGKLGRYAMKAMQTFISSFPWLS